MQHSVRMATTTTAMTLPPSACVCVCVGYIICVKTLFFPKKLFHRSFWHFYLRAHRHRRTLVRTHTISSHRVQHNILRISGTECLRDHLNSFDTYSCHLFVSWRKISEAYILHLCFFLFPSSACGRVRCVTQTQT